MHTCRRIRRNGDEKFVIHGLPVCADDRLCIDLGRRKQQGTHVLQVFSRDGDLNICADLSTHRHHREQSRRGKTDLLGET